MGTALSAEAPVVWSAIAASVEEAGQRSEMWWKLRTVCFLSLVRTLITHCLVFALINH